MCAAAKKKTTRIVLHSEEGEHRISKIRNVTWLNIIKNKSQATLGGEMSGLERKIERYRRKCDEKSKKKLLKFLCEISTNVI